jgi:hypothetical protein
MQPVFDSVSGNGISGLVFLDSRLDAETVAGTGVYRLSCGKKCEIQ